MQLCFLLRSGALCVQRPLTQAIRLQVLRGKLMTSIVCILQSVYVNVHRVMLVANRLLESGHYASDGIRAISANLDLEWKIFAAALDERRCCNFSFLPLSGANVLQRPSRVKKL